jgi:hypothetical protein
MGETCVTVTWLQLSLQLLALTGEARYADEAERTLFNHLAAAQRRDGSGWSYYTPLDGPREHGSGISCCISSGPRGMALLPGAVFATSPAGDELAVCQYVGASAAPELGGTRVAVALATAVPQAGGTRLTVEPDEPATFAVRFRRPSWAERFPADHDGWHTLPARRYEGRTEIDVDFRLGARQVEGSGWNAGRVSLAWGPLVLAYRPDRRRPVAFDHLDPGAPAVTAEAQPWSVRNALVLGGRVTTTLAPFSEAAHDARVWLSRAEPRHRRSAFHDATPSQSSGDPRRGSFNDYDRFSFAATASGAAPAWFALERRDPVLVCRVVFVHGRSLVHGGWFDTSGEKPRLEVQERAGGPWRLLAELSAYPQTDAAHDGGLVAGQAFEVVLDAPVEATGLRVSGDGAHGEYPPTRFVTCALLQAF